MADSAIELPPISEAAPCGPDLDLEGDATFMGFMATSEAPLPTSTSNSPGERGSYFNFNPKEYDLAGMIAEGDRFLARTQDIRLLILLAKISILKRDFVDFVRRIETIVWLLANRWEYVHPQAEEGEYFNRIAQLGSLDDLPAVALPLQYAPLIETRRDGPLAFRAHLVQTGEAKPREGELLASQSAIDRILSTVELETLEASAARADRLAVALKSLTAITSEKVGPGDAVKLKVLGPLVDRIRAFFVAAVVKRNPSAAEGADEEEVSDSTAGPATSGGGGAPVALTPLDTFEGIDAALGAALGYFANREPSSPALLLIRQAREALGKNLYDVMKLLAPTHADNARVFVGPDGAFTVPVSALSDGPTLDISRADPEPSPSRSAALSQIDAVATHLRRTEPSSPLPYLLDRARVLATRDFLSLLHELLPEDDIASLKNGR